MGDFDDEFLCCDICSVLKCCMIMILRCGNSNTPVVNTPPLAGAREERVRAHYDFLLSELQ